MNLTQVRTWVLTFLILPTNIYQFLVVAHWGLRCYRSEVLIEVATHDVLAALARPFQRDPGVLSRTPTVEFCPEVVGLCTPH
jgi:hypothetical protein